MSSVLNQNLRSMKKIKTSPSPLTFQVEAKCSRTRARVGRLRFMDTRCSDGSKMLDCVVDTPVFMPVGTAGTMKGILPEQVEATGCRLMLSNTYHLAARPGLGVVEKAGGLHNYMKWPHALLTDSGGFQMVSLSELTEITETGVRFQSPYGDGRILDLTPEESIRVQQGLGSNIAMQLDDVVSSTLNDDKRYSEAADRSVRWLDRGLEVHKERHHVQALFPIIQGGLNTELRRKNARENIARDTAGIAIGGLSGGEEKDSFVEIVGVCTEELAACPEKPRYVMGVGFTVDLLLCVALGADMFDCVFPTRTARFGTALVDYGTSLHLKTKAFATDTRILDTACGCYTCSRGYSRAYIHALLKEDNTLGCHLLTQHNIAFQMRFMREIRESIQSDRFVEHMFRVLDSLYESQVNYPSFVRKTLSILDIKINS